MAKPLFPLKVVYIDSSREDYLAFKRNIAGHPQLSRVFSFEVIFFKDIRIAYQWLRSQDALVRQSIDCIFFDTKTVGGHSTGNTEKAVKLLQSIGYEKQQIIALPSVQETEAVWIALKDNLGEEQVFQKEDALSADSLRALTDRIESLMSKRSTSGSRTLQYDLMRLEAKVEVLLNRMEDQYHRHEDNTVDLEEKIDNLQEQLKIINNTLFQGPGTERPAIVTELTELKRYAAGLDRDIGTLAEVHKERLLKIEQAQTRIDNKFTEIDGQRAEFAHQRSMKREDYIWRTLLYAGAVFGTVLLSIATSQPLESLINTILEGLANFLP